MDNLLALGRRYSFIGLAIGFIVLIMYCLEYRKAVREYRKPARKKSEAARKKKELTRAKQFLIGIGIIMLYFLWTGAPYIADCIERNTQTVRGEVIEMRIARVGKRGRVYVYTLKAPDETEIEVKVAGNHTEGREMEEGESYEVSYFSHSRAVDTVKELPKP